VQRDVQHQAERSEHCENETEQEQKPVITVTRPNSVSWPQLLFHVRTVGTKPAEHEWPVTAVVRMVWEAGSAADESGGGKPLPSP
jgi:hypothetical protein